FGNGGIALTGLTVSGDQVALQWSARGSPGGDYTVFVHALDAAGKVVAQHDGIPAVGSFPTRIWQPGDVITDAHDLGPGLQTATQLEIGLYDSHTLVRL